MEMRDVGHDDRLPYAKADIVLGCTLGEAFAFSFYQFDYQAAVSKRMAAEKSGVIGPVAMVPIPVTKVVLDRDGFARLYAEVLALALKNGVGR